MSQSYTTPAQAAARLTLTVMFERVTREAHQMAMAQRDQAIRNASTAGLNQPQIAEIADLTKMRVSQVLSNKPRKARP